MEKNSLARAYSTAANSLLTSALGDAVPEDLYPTGFTLHTLTEKQAQTFIEKSNLSIGLYRQIAAEDPAFDTRVGNIGMKVANEYVWQYHNMLVFAENYLGKLNLPDHIYHEDTLARARLTLEDCPPNSILLSYGDNDFYPVMYLQAKGVRPDVYLLNLNLMAIDRFIYRSTFPQFSSKPVELSLDTTSYKGDKNLYVQLSSDNTPTPVSNVLRMIREGNAAYKIPTNVLLPGKKVNGTVKDNAIHIEGNYLFREQIILLDIISNLEGRKLCFPANLFDQLSGLNDHLVQSGTVLIYNN